MLKLLLCFLVYLLTVRPFCTGLLEMYSRLCLPGKQPQGLQNSKDCCLFFPLVALSHKGTYQMSARALQYEVIPWIYRGQEPLEEAVCPLSVLKCCAGSSVATFRAAGQVHLNLLQWNS